jgi:hypothetical protein
MHEFMGWSIEGNSFPESMDNEQFTIFMALDAEAVHVNRGEKPGRGGGERRTVRPWHIVWAGVPIDSLNNHAILRFMKTQTSFQLNPDQLLLWVKDGCRLNNRTYSL